MVIADASEDDSVDIPVNLGSKRFGWCLSACSKAKSEAPIHYSIMYDQFQDSFLEIYFIRGVRLL